MDSEEEIRATEKTKISPLIHGKPGQVTLIEQTNTD